MESTLCTRLRDRLLHEADQLPPKMRLAAKYIVDFPNDFGLGTVRDSAARCHVSVGTFVRLAAHLGFARFEDLRAPFRAALTEAPVPEAGQGWLARLGAEGGHGAAQARAMRNTLNIVDRSLHLFTREKAEAAVAAILAARRVYVTATRASYALAYYFHYVARMALPGLQLIPRHMGSPTDEMMDVGPEDLLIAITFPPYSAETIRALRLARERRAKVILISDSELIAPRIEADHFLQVSTHSTHSFGCYAGAFAVLESLVALIFLEGGAAVGERVAAYQALREETGAYWKARAPRLAATGKGEEG